MASTQGGSPDAVGERDCTIASHGAGKRAHVDDERAKLGARKDIMHANQGHSENSAGMRRSEDVHHVRLIRVDTDKTRRVPGSEAVYRVCFVLSDTPAGAWKSAFVEAWKALGGTRPELQRAATIDGGFLFVECGLHEVPDTILPALKQAVATANASYRDHVQREEREQTRKEDVWKDERKSVEDMARLLHFD